MSVFKKVVRRVRDFFLEPETKTPAGKPVAASSSSTPRPSKAVEKPDAFEWEPPEKWRSMNAPAAEPSSPLVPWSEESAGAGDPPPGRPPAFSARNFSTEELQRSSVLDIVEAVGRVPTRPIPPPAKAPDLVPEPAGLPTELLDELSRDAPARPAPNLVRAATVEIAPLLVEEIPRPPASFATAENLGFASMLREAALRVDERETDPGPVTTSEPPNETFAIDSPSWALSARSLAGIEAVPPPFALDRMASTIRPEGGQSETSTASVGRPQVDDPTRTGEIDRPSFLLRPEPAAPAEPEREIVGVNTGAVSYTHLTLPTNREV